MIVDFCRPLIMQKMQLVDKPWKSHDQADFTVIFICHWKPEIFIDEEVDKTQRRGVIIREVEENGI